MTASELDQIQALVDHVLTDPTRFAQRLVGQLVTEWGISAEDGSAIIDTSVSAGPAQPSDTTQDNDVLAPNQRLINTNILLAAAMGACDCWGLDPGCRICRGEGSAGWVDPDPKLFNEFVAPAIARLPGTVQGDAGQHRDEDGSENRPRQSSRGPGQTAPEPSTTATRVEVKNE